MEVVLHVGEWPGAKDLAVAGDGEVVGQGIKEVLLGEGDVGRGWGAVAWWLHVNDGGLLWGALADEQEHGEEQAEGAKEDAEGEAESGFLAGAAEGGAEEAAEGPCGKVDEEGVGVHGATYSESFGVIRRVFL